MERKTTEWKRIAESDFRLGPVVAEHQEIILQIWPLFLFSSRPLASKFVVFL